MSVRSATEPFESVKKFLFRTENDDEKIEIIIPEVSRTIYPMFEAVNLSGMPSATKESTKCVTPVAVAAKRSTFLFLFLMFCVSIAVAVTRLLVLHLAVCIGVGLVRSFSSFTHFIEN